MNASPLLGLVLALGVPVLPAATLFVSQINPPVGNYGYGLPQWHDMTQRLISAFDSSNIIVSADPIGNVGGYDALWIMARSIGDPGLTPAEQANVMAFIATGRRVVMIGENSGWLAWNNSILATVGGTYAGPLPGNVNLAPAVAHPVTAGIATVNASGDGLASGGTSLFAQNVVTLWGPQQNVITILSIGMLDNLSSGSFAGNQQLKINLAQWLASPANPVPEPGAFSLAAVSFIALGVWARSNTRR